jgi:hypothetical protein
MKVVSTNGALGAPSPRQRIILEKKELLEILGRHFETVLDETSVVIRTEPFEVELTKVAMPTEEPPKKKEPPPAAVAKPQIEVVDEGPKMVNGFLITPATVIPENPELLELRSSDGDSTPPPPGADGFDDGTTAGDGSPASLVQRSRELAVEIDRANPDLANQNKRLRRGNAKEPSSDFDKEIA